MLTKCYSEMARLALTSDERIALQKACPYFPSSYFNYLSSMRLDPVQQVKLTFRPKSSGSLWGEIECVITGPWRDCIMYEVPILSICESYSNALTTPDVAAVSEGYFKFVDTDWSMTGVKGELFRSYR
jgi:nicotinate phosphoribosyltransferase